MDTARAVSCNGSNLVLTTFTTNGIHYTAILDTQDRFVFKYGYVEASINFDDSPGMWSAYWMESPTMGSYIGEPAYAGIEIDVCEHRKVDASGNNIDGQVVANLHWDGYGASHKSTGSGNIGSGLGTGFHTYAVNWTDTNYTFFIDGASKWSTTSAVSRRSEYLLLSSEVQSNSWAGKVPTAGYGDLSASTTKLYVDYVRYYAPTTMVFWQGSASDAWSNPANWRANQAPKPNDDLVFSLLSTTNWSTTLDRDYSVRSLSLLETAGSITLKSNTLTLGSGGIDMASAMYNLSLRSAVVLGAAQSWIVSANHLLHAYGPISGSGNLSVSGYGTVFLYASNRFSGDTRLLRGTLSLKHPAALQDSTLDLNAADLGSLNLNNLPVSLGGLKGTRPLGLGASGLSVGHNHQNTDYSGTLNGSGSFTKLGLGTQTLSGNNAYSGGTFVNSGTLKIANHTGSATGLGPVTIAPGATLCGSGSLSGPLTVQGTIAAGDGLGLLTTGDQTWNGGGSYAWEISHPTNSSGWDRLNISGSLHIAATPASKFVLKLASLTPAGVPGPVQGFNNQSNYTWTIVTVTGAILGFHPEDFAVDTAAFVNDLAGGAFTLEPQGNSVLLKFHPNLLPAQLTRAEIGLNGFFLLNAEGVPGKIYSLQSASNLVPPTAWSAVTNAQ
ncbi:MAG TPA: family 16 glycosylhydrolase, partial [Bacillota bacterium]|nr:family 16 glycosylhydrolase [Bacillota bacterium]